jgi:hypothetical protein
MPRIESVPKGRHGVYLDRAKEFARQMDRAATEKAWSSVGLLAVHSVISACDALTVHQTGRRWSGQGHAGVVGVVGSLNLPDSDNALRQISNALEKKNQVEYESRPFTERESEDLRRTATRILKWVTVRLAE